MSAVERAKEESKRKNTRSSNKVTWQGYVDCHLNEGDKEDITAELATYTPEKAFAFIAECVSQGYSFKIKPDDGKTTTSVQLMDMDASRGSAGWVLTAFHPDLFCAIATLDYKHNVKFSEGWVYSKGQRSMWG